MLFMYLFFPRLASLKLQSMNNPFSHVREFTIEVQGSLEASIERKRALSVLLYANLGSICIWLK